MLLASGSVIISPCRKSFTVVRLTFIYLPYESSLGQAFAHCPRFPTAAPRRSSGLVSVPTWLFVLPNQLRIIGLVSFYLTNYLNLRQPIQKRSIFSPFYKEGIQYFIPDFWASSTVLLTRSLLSFERSTRMCKARFQRSFWARIKPTRFSEQNLDFVFFLTLIPKNALIAFSGVLRACLRVESNHRTWIFSPKL